MTQCVIAFSGGVESTALLQYVKDQGYDPIALYSVFPQNTNNGVQANTINPNIESICDQLDVRLIIHEHQRYQINDSQNNNYFYSTRHWVLALCNAAMRFTHIKNFYWGANSGMLDFDDKLGDCSIVDPTKYNIQLVFDLLGSIPRHIEGYHEEDQKNIDGSYKNHILWKKKQTVSPPLIGWTKKQQWDYIRDDIKSLVQSCQTFDQCGECTKCEEFKLLNV